MTSVLEFVNVCKAFGYPWVRRRSFALDGLSFRVERGEIFGFLGPNGAGKTTAIHLAMGFLRPTSGTGHMLGEPFGHAPTRGRVGFVPETVPLYPRRARRLLGFYGMLNGICEPRLRERCRDVLRTVQLESESDKNVSRFSRGMQQRIGIAQALLNDPDLLVLDEPTSALDPGARVAIRELLLDLNRQGKTIFLSSHLLSEVEAICHRVAILRGGKVVATANTQDLLQAQNECIILARGVSSESFAGASADHGVVRIQVPWHGQKQTIERVWGMGGEVLSVSPAHRSLEEIFMEAIAQGPER